MDFEFNELDRIFVVFLAFEMTLSLSRLSVNQAIFQRFE